MSIAKKSKSKSGNQGLPGSDLALASGVRGAASPVRRLRRQPDAVRVAALESARRLLLAHGPDAITLKAVADDLGMTHTNLLHHFGSAAGLQSALMNEMTRTLIASMENAIARFRAGQGDVREFVDIVFDALDSGGAGRLGAWLMMSGNAKLFAPVGDAIREYISHIEQGAHVDPSELAEMHRRVTATTLFVIMTATGDAIVGEALHKMVDRERSTVRKVMAEILPHISAVAWERAK